MASRTIKLNQAKIKEMQDHYQAHLLKPVPYSVFRAKVNGTSITAYTSGKVLFQGKDIEQEVGKWSTNTNLVSKNTNKVNKYIIFFLGLIILIIKYTVPVMTKLLTIFHSIL